MPSSLPSLRGESSESRNLKLLGVQDSSTSLSATLRATLGMTECPAIVRWLAGKRKIGRSEAAAALDHLIRWRWGRVVR
jgi:hypothetical protein